MRPDNDTPGQVPGRLAGYQVVGVLGEGGSGTVYEARADGTPVALKVLRADQAPTGRERQRWIKEAEHLARIRHPGVVRVLGLGELDDGRPYLAMEHLHGVSLAERIAEGPLGFEQALVLFEQLAGAVQAIHDAGLIHRDLKPENVMLVDDGRRAVLLDLGIARPTDAPPSTTTQAGYQRGTPAVMAPERFFGERATVQSDIYELAVILFVMITGGLPWREILDAKQRLNPLTPGQVGVQLPPGTEAAIMRALSTEADARPATVREFADQVRAAGWGGATEPAVAPAPRPGNDATTTEARPRAVRWWSWALLAVGLLLFGGGVTAALLSGGEARPKPAARAKRAPIAPKQPVVVETIADTPAAPAATLADAGAADAGVVDAVPAPEAVAAAEESAAPPRPAPARPTKPRKRPPRASASPSSLPATPTGGTTMTWCRKQFAMYCTAEFKATEGSMAGELCTRMGKQLVEWEKLPAAAVTSLEDNCQKAYPTAAKAVQARLEMYQRMVEGKAAP